MTWGGFVHVYALRRSEFKVAKQTRTSSSVVVIVIVDYLLSLSLTFPNFLFTNFCIPEMYNFDVLFIVGFGDAVINVLGHCHHKFYPDLCR